MRLRGRTERSTTHPASIFAAATPATAFISCFARRVGRCSGASALAAGCQHKIMLRLAAILSEDSKESELVADPSRKAPMLVVFLDGRRIRLPNQSASLDEKKAGAAAQV